MVQVSYIECAEEKEIYTRIFMPEGCKDYTLYHFLTPMSVVTKNDVIRADMGSCIIFSPNEVQDISALRDCALSTVSFTMSDAEFNSFLLPTSEVFYPGRRVDEVSNILSNILSEYHKRDFGSKEMIHALMVQLFLLLSRNFYDLKIQPEGEPQLYHLFLQARQFMLENCDKEWASTNMCEMVSLKRSQFYKYYEEYFHVSPMTDLNNARISRAKHLLKNRELSVTKIATLCGYKSITHFSRTFKEHTGMSPLSYQEKITKRQKY